MKDAKRNTQDTFYLREDRLNPLGRIKLIRSILQISWAKTLPANICTMAGLQSQSISSRGSFSGTYIFSCHRHWENRELAITHPQWAYTAATGTTRISASGYFTNVSLAFRQISSEKFANSTQQSKEAPLSFTWAAIQRDNRYRYNGSYDLRAPRGCCRWIYSQEAARQTFLCSHYFQRRPYWTIAWSRTAERQCTCNNRGMAFPRKHYRKTTINNCDQQNTDSARWRILRQRYNQKARRNKDSLCHCCQNDSAIEKSNAFRQISRIRRRMGSGRICLLSVQLGSSSSFRGNSQATQVRTGRYPA